MEPVEFLFKERFDKIIAASRSDREPTQQTFAINGGAVPRILSGSFCSLKSGKLPKRLYHGPN
jgi:hypothetical protein